MDQIWHKCPNPFFPRRCVDGGMTKWTGQTWRRWFKGRWEYQQAQETEEEFLDRAQ